MRRQQPVWAAMAVLILASVSSHASIVVLMELDQLVGRSDAIVQGVVEDVQSRWEGGRIFTYATVRIQESLKGESGRTLIIRQVGGRVGPLELRVSGMPRFQAGGASILFLKNSTNGTFHTVGMTQGHYAIRGDYAVSNLTGVDFIDSKGRLVDAASSVRRVGVEVLKSRIRELVP